MSEIVVRDENTASGSSESRSAFYVKCRPQDADAVPIAHKYSRVFIGYPPWVKGVTCNVRNFREALVNLACGDDVWRSAPVDRTAPGMREVNMNRGFARGVTAGSMVAVPRPGQGLCHIGRVTGPFELVDDPPWGEEYLELRRKRRLDCEDEASHLGDVVQSWAVETLKAVPFPVVPRWISYRLLSRNTIGWLPDPPGVPRSAVQTLEALYEGAYSVTYGQTDEPSEVENRLIDLVSPSMFEQLMCALLQLENPDLKWWHTGGAGDGGSDGIAVDRSGRVVAVLQCKWMLRENPYPLGEALRRQLAESWSSDVVVYVASLFHAAVHEPAGDHVVFLSRQDVARLLLTHRDRVPLARTLEIAEA